MSIVIEQSPAEMHESHAFSSRAEIVGIRVSSASFSLPKPLSQDFDGNLSVGVRYAPKEVTLANECANATTLFECVITDKDELDPVAKFECYLTAIYSVEEGYIPTEAELNSFHRANVIFNCWPYFREFIQSAASRMNIPPPPIPFVRVHVQSKSKKIEAVRSPNLKKSKKRSPKQLR
jgi:hypothetical protein